MKSPIPFDLCDLGTKLPDMRVGVDPLFLVPPPPTYSLPPPLSPTQSPKRKEKTSHPTCIASWSTATQDCQFGLPQTYQPFPNPSFYSSHSRCIRHSMNIPWLGIGEVWPLGDINAWLEEELQHVVDPHLEGHLHGTPALSIAPLHAGPRCK